MDKILTPACHVAGVKQCLRLAAEGKLAFLHIAGDADEPIRQKLLAAAEAWGISYSQDSTRKELGRKAGIDVGAACIGLLKQEG